MAKKRVKEDSESEDGKAPKSKRNADLRSKSPAEFFVENKNIAGFDNPGKSLYTTIRELVENGLDAAESMNVLPEIEVTLAEMSKKSYNRLIGLGEVAKVDLDLYSKDTPEKKRPSKKQKIDKSSDNTNNNNSNAQEEKEDVLVPTVSTKKETMYYKVVVKDNGVGMAHDDIPEMFGRVLSGTKYGLKQTRGKFGLGSKMALIWSKMSTGLPIEIRSAKKGQSFISYCKLDINIRENRPNILIHEKLENTGGWRGTEISVTVEGSWTTYKSYALRYLRLMAVITPYARFDFRFVAESSDKSYAIQYRRRTDVMPPQATEVKHHPSAVNLLLLKQKIQDTKNTTLESYLCKEFDNIPKTLAKRIINEAGDDFASNMPVKSLTDQQVVRLLQLFKNVKFQDASGDCLSPAGEYNLRLGIIQQLQPDMVATFAEPVHVFEGHPFIVEAGVSLGGKGVKNGITCFRFANRIPLLFEGGGDVVIRTANRDINWKTYGINAHDDRIGVFVSIVSTKIPFKGTGKEYIGDEAEEIKDAVKAAIKHCCSQLSAKLKKAKKLRERMQAKKNLVRYIPDVARAVYGVLSQMTESPEAKKRRAHDPEAADLLRKVAKEEVTEQDLVQKLTSHIEQVDSEQALEYVASTGKGSGAQDDFYLVPLDPTRKFKAELRTSAFVLRLWEA